MSDQNNFSWDDEDWTRDFKKRENEPGVSPMTPETRQDGAEDITQNTIAPQAQALTQNQAVPEAQIIPQSQIPPQSQVPPQREVPLQSQIPPQNQAPSQGQMSLQGQVPPQSEVPPQNQIPQQGQIPMQNQIPPQSQVPPQGPIPPQKQLYQQTPPPEKKKKMKDKKPSFGVKLLKVIAIAAVFGIVAGCLFEAAVYFLGDALGLRTADVIEEAVGLSGSEEGEQLPDAALPDASSDVEGASSAAAKVTSVVASDVTKVVEEAIPSIVAITNISTVEYSNFWGQTGTYESEGAGSGIIIEKDDDYLYIVTNNHVVEGTDSNTVQFVDGETAPATIVGGSESRDIAVLEVALEDIPSETKSVIKVAVIGDSTALKVGEPAIAIGNALGYGQSVTVGVISALEREVNARDDNGNMITNNCIQTDAAINPGNSGGALLNAAGEVVGINEIKFARTEIEGISYAIPMATIEPVMRRIIAREDVQEGSRAYLGVQGIDVTQDISQHYNMPVGVYIAQVLADTPAEKAGIYAGDIITAIDEEPVRTNEELQQVIGSYTPGTTVTVKIMRTNRGVYEELEVTATLGSRNDG